jgi:hypothetical protein
MDSYSSQNVQSTAICHCVDNTSIVPPVGATGRRKPSTWAMMLVGFVSITLAKYRARGAERLSPPFAAARLS